MAKVLEGDLALEPLPQHILQGVSNRWNTDVTFDNFLKCISTRAGIDLTGVNMKLNKPPNRKINRPRPQHTKKRLTQQERRRLGLYTLGKKEVTYKQMLAIHSLWKDYMRNLLNLNHLKESGWSNSPEDPNFELVGVKLYRADYHGALMTVVQSKCSSLVGISGIVAMETKNCLRLVGKDDKCRTVPKECSQFEFRIDDFKFSFFGKNFIVRPAERSNRKIKISKPPCL